MASPSNSELESTYDIFLSFRGEDTRKKFTDHLYKALKDATFNTFRDEEEIPMGEFIKPELEKAIMNSMMSVIVLSQNYAKSTACLFELQLILERRKTQDHFVLPVFYEVDPEEIKKQAQKLDFGEKVVAVENMNGWRAALTDVARMKGMVLQNQCDGYEAKFIEEIVGEVKSQLLSKRMRVADHQVSIELPIGRRLIPPTKDFVDSTEGRNKENVWKCLMNEEFRKIGVYGMGGVGKTTIMKDIHNLLLEERGKFDSVFWVTVSKEFNITTLQRDIGNRLSLSFSDAEDETNRSSELHAVLSRKKRYVLILDDLWQAFPLESVGIPEPTRSNGCKLVLTTRSLEVCRRMDCKDVKVELLSEQEALTLFLSKAVAHDKMLALEVEEIATKVAKECARLPLAIVTVAGSMRGLTGKRDWSNALHELISSTNDTIDGESKVFERLEFSYRRLGSEVLQYCFLYCSLYPEDQDIPVKELVEYWIAEGLIAEMTSVEAKFDKGHALLEKLTSSCLLERSTARYEPCVRMHDLVRDMALRITQISPRFMVKSGVNLGNVPYEEWSEEWSEDLERIFLMSCFIQELPMRPPDCPQLTTLLLGNNKLSEIPDSFFAHMPRLEVLDLSYNGIKSLPESISNLENLHALILAECSDMEYVPSLEKMKALKVFKLTDSRIKEAPKGIEELVNLRELDLSDNEGLKTFPSSMLYRLSKLQCLRLGGTQVEVLAKDLVCLRQLKVVVIRLHNIQELTAYVTSQRVQGLENYLLVVGEYPEEFHFPYGDNYYVFVNILSKPYRCGADKLVLPNNVAYLDLVGFRDLIRLLTIPGLKNATHLRTVDVSYCDGLESIFSSSSFSEDGEISLRTVEEFYLYNLPSFRVLFDGIAPPRNISFNLKRLTFERCDMLKNIFPVQLLQNFPHLEVLEVDKCENVEDIIVGEEEMSDSNTITLPRLQELRLASLPRLKSIYTRIMVCESLKSIRVWDCPMVRRLPLSLHMNNDQATAPPALNCIGGAEEWWESLGWDDPLTKTILQPFFLKECKRSSFSFDEEQYVDSDEEQYVDSDEEQDEEQYVEVGHQVFMDRNYMFLHEISDRTIRWKIKVRVIRITGPPTSKDGQSTYKRFLLQDEEGDTIKATLFESDFERFNGTLELHKTYFLSRAVLTKIDPQFATSNGHDCQMIIKSYTYVERVEDSVTNPPTQKFNFLPLSTLSQLSSPPPQIDIVGIVVGVSHKEKRKRKWDSMDFSIREIMLTDDTRKITKVATWGAFIDNECETLSNHLQDKPVVVITNVKLKEIHGCMTISTTQSSEILINPGMPEARQLESWKIENVEYLLNTWTDNESSSNIRTTTIKEISESPNMEKDYYVKAFVTSILPQEKCWYMSCNICHKKTDEPISTIFTCKNCQRKNVTAEPWCCVRVELGDATGVLPATLFGRHAEYVLACEAKALFNLDIEEQLDLMERWSTERTTTEFVFHVKVAQHRNSLRLDVMSVDDV